MTRLLLTLFAIGCGDKTTEDTSENAEQSFQAGAFQFTNQAVDDQCLDGGFNVLFIPDGTSSDWQNTVELPSEEELPKSYTIELQEPFSSMAVTVSSGGDGVLVIEEATQEGVLFDEDNYRDCLVDLGIQADINIIDENNITGVATLSVTNSQGETCPQFNSSPCNILLDFTGIRQ